MYTNFIENFSGVWSPRPKVGITFKQVIGAAVIGIVGGVIISALIISVITL